MRGGLGGTEIMTADLQQLILAQALHELSEAQKIIMLKGTNPEEIARTGSPTNEASSRISNAQSWLREMTENL